MQNVLRGVEGVMGAEWRRGVRDGGVRRFGVECFENSGVAGGEEIAPVLRCDGEGEGAGELSRIGTVTIGAAHVR